MTAEQPVLRTAKIIGVKESLVLVEVDENTSLMKNELGYIRVGAERLKAEVLRVRQRISCRSPCVPSQRIATRSASAPSAWRSTASKPMFSAPPGSPAPEPV